MYCIILAAGIGKRLLPDTKDKPKCLLRVGNKSIIEYQIQFLKKFGFDKIVIVTGHGAEIVRKVCGNNITYVHNKDYNITNSLYSLHLAKEYTKNGCLIFNSDVLFHPKILGTLINAPYDDCLMIDFKQNLGEEEMKVITENSIIREISKDIDPEEAEGENLGLIKLGSKGARLVFKEAERLINNGTLNAWVPFVFNSLCKSYDFYAIGIEDFPWIEIDYHHDFKKAEGEILPKILA